MRRKDREITDPHKIDGIILQCDCLRLAFADGALPYIVPLNFGYLNKQEGPVFYFHGAKEGRKIDLVRKCGIAGFELDTKHTLHTHDKACLHSFGYQSLIGTGKVSIVDKTLEKRAALELIMRQCTGKSGWEFDERALDATAVIRLEVDEMACKEHE